MSIPENPWFLQAVDDLKMAKFAFANGFYSQTCYHASQSAEVSFNHVPLRPFSCLQFCDGFQQVSCIRRGAK